MKFFTNVDREVEKDWRVEIADSDDNRCFSIQVVEPDDGDVLLITDIVDEGGTSINRGKIATAITRPIDGDKAELAAATWVMNNKRDWQWANRT